MIKLFSGIKDANYKKNSKKEKNDMWIDLYGKLINVANIEKGGCISSFSKEREYFIYITDVNNQVYTKVYKTIKERDGAYDKIYKLISSNFPFYKI